MARHPCGAPRLGQPGGPITGYLSGFGDPIHQVVHMDHIAG